MNYYDTRNRSFEDKRKRKLTRWDLVWDSVKAILLFPAMVLRRPHEMLESYPSSMYVLGPTPTRLYFLWRMAVDSIRMYRLRTMYEARTHKPDYGNKYIYFPLQYQPERTSIPMGGIFADQLLALRLLSECLPEGWIIYVKEHPRQFTDNAIRATLGRSRQFYEALFQIPHVVPVSISAPSQTLIAWAKAVATVGGTAGWEALEWGIPALVFGHTWYMRAPGVMRIHSRAQCVNALASLSSVNVEAVHAWADQLDTFSGYMHEVYAKDSRLTQDENARSYADAIGKALAE